MDGSCHGYIGEPAGRPLVLASNPTHGRPISCGRDEVDAASINSRGDDGVVSATSFESVTRCVAVARNSEEQEVDRWCCGGNCCDSLGRRGSGSLHRFIREERACPDRCSGSD